MYPWPVAYTLLNGERFKVYKAHMSEGTGHAGEIIEKTKRSLVVACGQGALSLELVQPSGKPKLIITDFLNGHGRSLEVGDILGK